jgi:hypothetical protein
VRDLQELYPMDVAGPNAGETPKGLFKVEELLPDQEIEQARSYGCNVVLLQDADAIGRERQREVGGRTAEGGSKVGR